jgi:YbbR domain-containing protein
LLAFATFIAVDSQSSVLIDQYAEILYDQQVTAVYNEASYVVEGLPDKVDITLIGQRRHIFLAKQSPSKGVSVDLTGLKTGNHKVTLKYTQRLRSLDYKLDPSQVTVTIYEKVSENRSLTYDILHQDSLDTKLYISGVEIDRNDVIVKGAQYKLDQVASVKALLDVNNIPNPKAGDILVKDIPLVAYDNDGKILDVEIVPKTVTANVTITSPSKEVPVKVVPVGNLAFGKSIKSMETSLTKITVYGSQEAIDQIEQLPVEIDVKGLEKDKEYNVTLKKPKGITELSSKTMTVKVIIDNSSSKEFEGISVQSENLADNLKVQALSDEYRQVTVVVKGSEESLKNITNSDIKAYIDLKDFGVGEHEVDVQVTGSDLKLTYASKTKKIKVRITEK